MVVVRQLAEATSIAAPGGGCELQFDHDDSNIAQNCAGPSSVGVDI